MNITAADRLMLEMVADVAKDALLQEIKDGKRSRFQVHHELANQVLSKALRTYGGVCENTLGDFDVDINQEFGIWVSQLMWMVTRVLKFNEESTRELKIENETLVKCRAIVDLMLSEDIKPDDAFNQIFVGKTEENVTEK
jgi:hypothetical protein